MYKIYFCKYKIIKFFFNFPWMLNVEVLRVTVFIPELPQ